MSVLSDKWIRKMSKEEGMISPFEEKQVRGDNISYGLSSFGYDARVSDEFKIFTNVNSEIVDPKNFKATNFVTKYVSECIVPPNSFVLARTVEKFKIPDDVLVVAAVSKLPKVNVGVARVLGPNPIIFFGSPHHHCVRAKDTATRPLQAMTLS